MDGFIDSFQHEDGEDPAAEFLAREQSNLAGLVEGSGAGLPLTLNGLALEAKPERDDLGAAGENESDSGFELVSHASLDASIPAPGQLSANLFALTNGGRPSTSPIPSSFDMAREEPEKIRRWREEQKKRLEKKDADEEKRKVEMREGARKELDEWYSAHEEQVSKNRTMNRETSKSAEKELVADTDPIQPGTEWERIAKLCDFNPKGSKHQKDISRMRSIILQVKQAPPAAAAASRK